MNTIPSLEKLRLLVDTMPDHTPGDMTGNVLELEALTGNGYAIGLIHVPHVASASVFLSAGSLFPVHFHPEKEIIIVYEGRLQMWFGEPNNGLEVAKDAKIYGPGEVIVIEPLTPHKYGAVLITRALTTTIPSSPYFPKP